MRRVFQCFWAASWLLSACGSSSARTAAPVTTQPTAGTALTAAECKVDADCKAVSRYCDACKCLPLPVTIAPPACRDVEVQCLVSPCLGKQAICRRGSCALTTADGPATR